jgi:hypothetical protein
MRRFRAPTHVLMVAVSLLVVAAAVFAVTASAESGSRSNHRNKPFHLTKECSQHAGGIGSYCTVTSSNVAAIKVGTRIFYAQAAGPTSLDSDVILYAGSGNTATGHCALDFATGLGQCSLSGGTGTLDGIRARVKVSSLGEPDFAWDGTYRFRKDDDEDDDG